MSAVLLYPLFFLFLLFRIKNKRNHLVYTLIIAVYLLSSLCACYLVLYSSDFSIFTMSVLAVLFHILAFYLLLTPVCKIDELRYKTFKLSPDAVVIPFTYFILVVEYLNFINNIGAVSFNELLVNAGGLRQDMVGQGTGLVNSSFASYVYVIAQEYQLVPLVLYFYWIIRYPERKVIISLLLIASLFYPILSLRVVSRDVIIRYLVLFVIFFYLLYPLLAKRTRKSIKAFFVVVAVTFVGLFIIISMSRFGAESTYDNTVSYSFLSYLGQGVANFSDRFVLAPDGIFPDSHGSIHFPIIPGTGRSSLFLNEESSSILSLNAFPTAIGTWIEDCGIAITCLLIIIYSFLIRVISRIKEKNVFTLIYIVWVYDFVYITLFYYDAKVYIYKILAILIVISLDIVSRNSKNSVTAYTRG